MSMRATLHCGIDFHNMKILMRSVVYRRAIGSRCKTPRGVTLRPNPANRSGTQSIERAIAVLECLSAAETSADAHRDRPASRLDAEHDASAAAGARDMRVTSTRITRPSNTDSASASPCSASGRSNAPATNWPAPCWRRCRSGPANRRASGSGAEPRSWCSTASPARRRCGSTIRRAPNSPSTHRRWARCCSPSRKRRSRTKCGRSSRSNGSRPGPSSIEWHCTAELADVVRTRLCDEQRGAIRRRVRNCRTRALVRWPRPRRCRSAGAEHPADPAALSRASHHSCSPQRTRSQHS